MKKAYLKIIAAIAILAITVGAFIHLSKTQFQPGQLRDLFSDIPSETVVMLIALSTLMTLTRAYRFYLLLRNADIKLNHWQALKVYIAGQALSPLPAGEGSRTVLLKLEADASLADVTTPLIMLGVSEVIVSVLVALAGSIFLNILRVASILALIGTAGLVWLLVNRGMVRKIFSKLPDNPKLQKVGKAVVKTQAEVRQAMFHEHSWVPSNLLLWNLLIALGTALLGGSIVFVAAQQQGLPLSFLASFYVFASATVLGELVPFSVGGIGATEGGMVGILLAFSIILPNAVALVLIFRTATLLYGVLIGAIFLLAFYGGPYLSHLKKR